VDERHAARNSCPGFRGRCRKTPHHDRLFRLTMFSAGSSTCVGRDQSCKVDLIFEIRTGPNRGRPRATEGRGGFLIPAFIADWSERPCDEAMESGARREAKAVRADLQDQPEAERGRPARAEALETLETGGRR